MMDHHTMQDRQMQKEEESQRRKELEEWRLKHRKPSWGMKFLLRIGSLFMRLFVKKPQTPLQHEKERIKNIKRIYRKDRFAKGDRKRQKEEKRQRQAQIRSMRRRHRMAQRREFRQRLSKFFVNPFAFRQPTPEQLAQRRIKKRYRSEKSEDRKKWLAAFRKNPYRTLFPKKWSAKEVGYIPHQTKKDRQIAARKRRKILWANFKIVLSTPELRKKFAGTYLQSTAYYILSFLLIYVIYQLVTIFVARLFNIPVIWYYYQLKFPLYTYSNLYTRAALVTIFGMGPVVSLVLALIFLRLFFSKSYYSKNFQLFNLWVAINGLNMFFGAYIIGFLTRTEFIYTSEWLLMSRIFDVEEIIFTVLSLTVLILVGRHVASLFLVSSGSVTLVSPEYRLFFIISQVILPWITGGVLLFLVTTPTHYIPLILKTLTPGLILIPSLFTYNSLRNQNIHESGLIRRNYFRWGIVVMVIALLFFYRVILNFGWKLN